MQWKIEEIIQQENIVIYFQPIISTYHDRVDGVEALVRGLTPSGELIPPMALFQAAQQAGQVIALDRLCQRKAIESFSRRGASQQDMILFLNVDNSVIHLDAHTDAIYDYCIQNDVSPGNVVLEINELHTSDMAAVKKFTKTYKAYGFMISIDDIGAGYSNLDRIVALKPDIIKIDRELIRHVDKHYYKQQIVEMIIRMAEKTGALVVAEGIEELEEALTVLRYGAQLLQGFYISRPMDMRTGSTKEVKATIRRMIDEQKAHLATMLEDKCRFNLELRETFQRFKAMMTEREEEQLKDCLASGNISACLSDILTSFTEVECAYIIDQKGRQMTDTVFHPKFSHLHKKSLFSPYREGADATLKAYYYVLRTTNQPQYVSEEYLSLATGHRCITISGSITWQEQRVILCLDVIREELESLMMEVV